MKILIVDDNSDDRTLLRYIIEKKGHEPFEARDGREGLKMAAAHRPDLIISDALMPVMDGFMFLRAIKEDTDLCTIPFIFYSANYQADQDVELAESMGACAYIFKPMAPMELWTEIESIVRRCRDKNNGLPVLLKEDQLKYLKKYRDIITAKLEQKVTELERALQQRDQAEQQIKKQRDFLQRALDALTHPFFIINIHDRTVEVANQAARTSNYRPGIKCHELTHNQSTPCDGCEHPCPIDEVKKVRGPVVMEHIHPDADGRPRHTEVHGYPVFAVNGEITQVIEYCIDISDRKKDEEERRRLTTVMEQAADSIIITNRSATIKYVNPSFERITGFSKEEAVGKNPKFLQSGQHNAQFYRHMWGTLTKGEVWRGELINRKKDGTLFTEEASITPVLNQAGEIINYVAIKRDVTEQKQLKEHLQQAQKMEAIGTLAGGIAHDFNNILTAILGYGEMVCDELPRGSEIRMHQEQIIHACSRAKELVKQILTFSRQTAQEPQPVQIHLIVKEALKLLHSSLPANIKIRDDINSKVGMVMADPTQLHQIVMNLSTNAYHAMREMGGELTVTLGSCCVEQDDRLRPEIALPPGHYVTLEVRDTGHGMDQLTREKIFDPYFTTKEKGEGTGLGLAIVHGIVTSCGGHIEVSSEPGTGTTFRVYLPRLAEQHPASATTMIEEYPRGTEKILLVDDDEVIAMMEQKMLESLGYQTDFFTESKVLLQRFAEAPDDYDLIITDMTMPEMSGRELSKRVLEIRPDIPIILCTGFSEQIDEMSALQLGIKTYLMKPVTKSELALTVRKLLDGEKK